VYALLAVYNEALRIRHERTRDPRFVVPNAAERAVFWEALLWLRHNGHLPGHAEMEGNTLFFKLNTGPSGHGMPAAVGEALALKHAGAGDVRVFAVEGEGGHTAGAHHESKNSAYGLGLDNLVVLFDWNDHGIDPNKNSSVVHGDPRGWYEPYGWRVAGTRRGEDHGEIARALSAIVHDPDPAGRPGMAWFETRKGRGYHKFDHHSHGTPHKRNSELFWRCRADFSAKYGVEFAGAGEMTDPGEERGREQTRGWFETVFSVLRDDAALVEYLSDTLVELGESVPAKPAGFRLASKVNLAADRAWLAPEKLPAELFVAPGTKAPNRQGFSTFGAWLNAEAAQHMGRPLVLACSADLADSTNISGFAKASGDFPGFGWYERARWPPPP
jgi:transketolase